ncbi:MAG: ATP-binding cassette domain-containing protein, partial [Gaiella sp.]
LRPGEMVALVGPSGSGKSTLVALLLRLAEPTEGTIVVDGTELATVDASAWRRRIAWVPQHPTLLAATLAENIRLGDPLAADDAVLAAVDAAGLRALVAGLPDGLATVVGDGGRPLSTGERRRVGLARAFLRDAPLVVLDEPTADLDPAAARGVADAIERLRARRTVLLVAHRPELAALADRIVRLDGGRARELPVEGRGR